MTGEALPEAWRTVLDQHDAGEISDQIALTRLLLAGGVDDPAARLEALADEGGERRRALARLAGGRRKEIERIGELVASGLDPGESVEATRALFDRLACTAPEAGVALYSLGDPKLLKAATDELVATIGRWTELAGAHVLDFGCGIGRLSIALAPKVGSVLGVDVSGGMLTEARRRAEGLANVRFAQSDGSGLGDLSAGSFDLILAVDSFPYLVRAGDDVLTAHVGDFARALRPGGALIVFNWSYRGDAGQDIADARRLAAELGLELVRAGERPFAIWDGIGFHLKRPE